LNFDCEKCAARPIGVRITSEKGGTSKKELEPSLADSFSAFVIQNGLPKEHVNPWILPGP